MAKSRFVGKQTVVLKLDDDEVTIKSGLAFEEFRAIMASTGYGTGDMLAGAVPLLKRVIVAWTFKDEDGNAVPVTPENIDLLDSQTIFALTHLVMPIFTPEKKSLKQSEPE